MKVTGYRLREAIKRAVQRNDIAKQMFRDSVMGFDGEAKDPVAAGEAYSVTGTNVALLQAAQQRYNDSIVLDDVQVNGRPVTLAVAVKLVGHAGSVEKEWRTIATGKKERVYGSDPSLERDTSKLYAKKLVTPAEALARSDAAGKFAAELRAAIAVANNTELDIILPDGLV